MQATPALFAARTSHTASPTQMASSARTPDPFQRHLNDVRRGLGITDVFGVRYRLDGVLDVQQVPQANSLGVFRQQ